MVFVTAGHMVYLITGRTIDRPQVVVAHGRIVRAGTAISHPSARRLALPDDTLLLDQLQSG